MRENPLTRAIQLMNDLGLTQSNSTLERYRLELKNAKSEKELKSILTKVVACLQAIQRNSIYMCFSNGGYNVEVTQDMRTGAVVSVKDYAIRGN